MPSPGSGAMDHFKAAAKKSIAPAVAANLPKELPTAAHEAVLDALKEK